MSKMNPRDLPEWMNNFISTFSKDKAVTASTEKESMQKENLVKSAELNVKDLPKVVWNDETFYVMFDNNNATVLNEFGNTVTTIKNASNVETVDKHLNGKQVVTSDKKVNTASINNIFEEELTKVSAYMDDESESESDGEPVATLENKTADNDEFGVPPADSSNPGSTDNQNGNSNGTDNSNGTTETEQQVNNLESDVNSTTSKLETMDKMAAIEAKIQTLTKQVIALTQQLKGYTDPGAIYDLNVGPAEEQHFQDMALQSAQEIEREHQVDLTTMQGRVSLFDKIMPEIDSIMNNNTEELFEEQTLPVEIPEDEPVEIEVEVDKLDSNEEDKGLDKGSDEEIELPEEKVIIPEDTEIVEEELPELDVDVDEVKEDPEGEDNKKDHKETDKEINTDSEEKSKKESSKKSGIVKLNSRDSKIFAERICVACGEKQLVPTNKVANMQGVYCECCKTEYGVDMNTSDIYKKD